MRCRVCGSTNADDAARCGSCGRALRTPTDKVHSLTPVAASSSSSGPVASPQTVPLRPSLLPQLTEGGQHRVVHEPPPDEDRFRAGTVILKHYTIEKQLGRGGMGAVYLAVDDVSGQRVAVKVLPSWLARDRDLRERFVLEARALAALDHPGIVPLITFAHDGDDRFLVMKYVAGEVLENRVRNVGVLGPTEAARVLRAMCDALASAHDKGVIHRDIKPTNVLIDDAGKVVIVDFGIARNSGGDRKLTETGMLMGTPQYMSPEQIGGRPVDGRADLYACGLVFFEMLVGRPPFDGEQTFDVLRAQVDAPVPDLRAARALRAPDAVDVPQRLVDLCLWLLEKDPEDRPASGHDVVAMIDGNKPVPSRSPTPTLTLSSSSSVSKFPSVSSSWASLPSSPRTSQTPALAFADDNPDDDLVVIRRSPWRTPLWLLASAGFGVGLWVTATAIDEPAGDIVAADAGVDSRFELAALSARARVALDKHRLDDARVAVDTALSLASGDELIEPLLLRAEIMIAGNNTVEAAATLRRLPTSLSPEQQARRDVLLGRLAGDPTPPKPHASTSSKPAAPKPEAPKPEAPKPEAPKPEAPKPEAPKPEAPKPEAPKPEAPPAKQEPLRPSALADDDFDAAIRASRAQVSFCYAEHVLSDEATEAAVGSMTLKATIANDGTVRRVAVDKSDFDNAAFSACVIKAVGEWEFAPFTGGDDVVTHVFNFKPRGT